MIYTNTDFGYETQLVNVEAYIRRGIPAIDMVGIADSAVKAVGQRVKAAITNCGLTFPTERVIVELSPCDLKKEGGRYDLPIALAILSNQEGIETDIFCAGELELSGNIRPVKAVSAGLSICKNTSYAILPLANQNDTVPLGVKVFYTNSLFHAYNAMKSIGTENEKDFFKEVKQTEISSEIEFYETEDDESLNNLKPREDQKDSWNFLKYAMAVSVAGHHHIITTGKVDSGRTFVMQHFPNLLPKLIKTDETERIYSIAGLNYYSNYDKRRRPFRMPHQTATIEGMCGGGVNCRPGEVSLAHNGVLFLDETAEFRSSVLQMLRVPINNHSITLSRAGRTVVYPANFTLAMSTSPCPCGNYGSKTNICLCSETARVRYWQKFSLPLLDTVAIRVNMNDTPKDFKNYSQDELRAKIKKAWETQFARGCNFNNDLQDKNCLNEITENAKFILSEKIKQFGLLNTQAEYILKLARTVADMEGHKEIYREDMEMALNLNLGFEKIKKVM